MRFDPRRRQPSRRFAYEHPVALVAAMYVGLFLGFVLVVALVNGWLGFSLLDPLGEGTTPLPLWVVNLLAAGTTILLFVGTAVLVPYEVRVEEDQLVLERLLGERRLVGDELLGVSETAPHFCLVYAGRLAYLLLPHLGDLEELQRLIKEMAERRRQ